MVTYVDTEKCRHGDMQTWRYEDMETWRYGDMDTWTHGRMDMETWRYGDMEIWRHGHMDAWTWRHGDIKRKTEAQPFFLNLFTVCSSCKRKLVVCKFVGEETNGSYLFVRTKCTKRTKRPGPTMVLSVHKENEE